MGVLDGWLYCPRCGAALTSLPDTVPARCPNGHEFWANPVPGSQAVVERDGRVLLGRRAFDPAQGLWDLPGGFLEEHEHPLDALHRELAEETGLVIEPTEFLGVWMQPYAGRNVLCLTWLARPSGGVERAGDDLTELRWFGPDELPGSDELAFETFVEILALWRGRQEHT
ncbi:MAG TPA: NUDIX domain-containing protein [Gaiellaceae bacterium]|nr:NUDIX domain-containing protein [Gaiellaceae bacterium]